MKPEGDGVLNSWRIAFAAATMLAAAALILSVWLAVQTADESDRNDEAVRQGQVQNCRIVGVPLQRAVANTIEVQLYVLSQQQQAVAGHVATLARRDVRLLRELRQAPPCRERYPPLP